jgi:PIN domain nuclease of toxin-antitoxin system
MICAVADTHALIWYLFDDERLSRTARKFMDDAAKNGEQIGISSISLIEIVYLVEKDKINHKTFERLLQSLNSDDAVLVELPVTGKIAGRMREVARETVPDMPDRIIAATALELALPIISRDRKIKVSKLETIW